MKLTDREKHILQVIALFAFCTIAIVYSAVHDRIVKLQSEAEMWQRMCNEWRDNTWYWQDAYFDLLYETEFQRNGEAKLTLLDAGNQNEDIPWVDVGDCRITFYCPCEKCNGQWAGQTAIGVTPQEGRTVAVDRNVIPLGSEVLIDGHIYIAEDTGVSGRAVDIFLNNHQRCYDLGTYTTNVKWRPTSTNT